MAITRELHASGGGVLFEVDDQLPPPREFQRYSTEIMSGTLQLLTHVGVAGFCFGLVIALMADAGMVRLTIAGVFWFAGYLHFADAAWIPSWGRGRDLIDRIGIAVTGTGFVVVATAALVFAPVPSFILAVLGLSVMMFGRILWELLFAERHPH